jgi:zinc protease
MLEGVLSSGKSARFYRTLVHEQRLALQVDAGYDRTAIDAKTFTIAAQPQPGVSTDELEAAIARQISDVQAAPPSPEEMGRARAQIEASFVFAQDSMFYRALLLGTYEIVGGWRQIDDFLPAIAKVTPEDVQRVAKTYLVDKNRTAGELVPLPTDPAAPPERMPSGAIH